MFATAVIHIPPYPTLDKSAFTSKPKEEEEEEEEEEETSTVLLQRLFKRCMRYLNPATSS
jgi:hypothetical protein